MIEPLDFADIGIAHAAGVPWTESISLIVTRTPRATVARDHGHDGRRYLAGYDRPGGWPRTLPDWPARGAAIRQVAGLRALTPAPPRTLENLAGAGNYRRNRRPVGLLVIVLAVACPRRVGLAGPDAPGGRLRDVHRIGAPPGRTAGARPRVHLHARLRRPGGGRARAGRRPARDQDDRRRRRRRGGGRRVRDARLLFGRRRRSSPGCWPRCGRGASPSRA